MNVRSIVKASGVSYVWLIIGALHISMATGHGIHGSFGVFVNPLSAEMDWSRTAISGAASTLMCTHLLTAGVWGLAADRWSIRWVIVLSGALFGLGVFLTSTAQNLWQLYIYWGVIGGIGMGGQASSLAGLATRWVEQRRVLALGIGFAGIGVGMAVLPLLTERLISMEDWRLGFRVLSFIAWGMFLLVAVVVRVPPVIASVVSQRLSKGNLELAHTSSRGVITGLSRKLNVTLLEALRTRGFWILCAMQLAITLLVQTTFVHLVPRAEDAGVDPSRAASLLTVIGVCSIMGKVGGGFIGDRFGPRRVFIIGMLVQALIMVWLTQSDVLWMFYLFAAAYGIVYGIWGLQLAGITVRLFGTVHMGAIFGGTLIGAAVGAIIGPITAGYVFDTTGSYFIAFAMTAGVALVGALLAILLKKEPGTV